jgi:hypothetical protein
MVLSMLRPNTRLGYFFANFRVNDKNVFNMDALRAWHHVEANPAFYAASYAVK